METKVRQLVQELIEPTIKRFAVLCDLGVEDCRTAQTSRRFLFSSSSIGPSLTS